MSKVSSEITTAEVQDEFRVCPKCGYELGFHVSFQKSEGSDALSLILICPTCGARYQIEGLDALKT